MTSHRSKDRRNLLRGGALASGLGVAITFQNNRLGWAASDGASCTRTPSAARSGSAASFQSKHVGLPGGQDVAGSLLSDAFLCDRPLPCKPWRGARRSPRQVPSPPAKSDGLLPSRARSVACGHTTNRSLQSARLDWVSPPPELRSSRPRLVRRTCHNGKRITEDIVFSCCPFAGDRRKERCYAFPAKGICSILLASDRTFQDE